MRGNKMRIIIDEKEEIFIFLEADECRLTMKNRLIMSRLESNLHFPSFDWMIVL